jgi:hypothetical protein
MGKMSSAKTFYTQERIGRAKYVVGHHDGEKKHRDGSNFFDVTIFRNKKKLAAFVAGLLKSGYQEAHQ